MFYITGRLFEAEMFGCCRPTRGKYLPWRKAAVLAAKRQPERKASFASRLERAVGVELGIRVVFFTAVGTSFDHHHGVDGFFVTFEGKVVTLDLTRNPHKDSGKADIVLHEEDCDNVSSLAGRIAREFHAQSQPRLSIAA